MSMTSSYLVAIIVPRPWRLLGNGRCDASLLILNSPLGVCEPPTKVGFGVAIGIILLLIIRADSKGTEIVTIMVLTLNNGL